MNKKTTKIAYEVFYFKYCEIVFNYVNRRISDRNDCEDIAAEIFIAMWKNWDNIDSSNVKNLLFTISKNKINDYLRNLYKRNSQMVVIDPDLIPHENIIEKEKRSQKAINFYISIFKKLKPREKQYLELRYKENFTFKEIANELGITINYAKVINNRLIRKIKKLYFY